MNVTKVVLSSRPGPDQPPNYSNFEVKHDVEDFDGIAGSEKVLVKTLFLSVDPALRFVFSFDTFIR